MDKKTKENLWKLAELSSNEAVFVVGGTLRDHLMGRPPTDMDFAVKGASRLAELFSTQVKVRQIHLHKTPGNETLRVVTGRSIFFDFSEMQGASIEQDLARRDFTINAMATPLKEFVKADWKPIDLFNGRIDLEQKIVRALPGATFKADPLRIIRAFRFAATLGFNIEKDTLQEITKNHTDLNHIAAERISFELILLLSATRVFPVISLMNRTGVLGVLFPEVYTADKNPVKGDGALETFESLENLICQPGQVFPESFSGINEFLSGKKCTMLKLAALLYPICEKQGDQKGSTVETILKRLRFPNNYIYFIEKVLEHQEAALSTELEFEKLEGDTSRTYSFVKNCEELFIPVLFLAAARLKKQDQKKASSFVKIIHHLIEFYQNQYLPAQNQPILLTGDDLIQKFKLSPSPVFKNILERVEEARVLGSITTKKEAESFARSLIRTLT